MIESATFKKTGLDWMPEVPEHREVQKLKYSVNQYTEESIIEETNYRILKVGRANLLRPKTRLLKGKVNYLEKGMYSLINLGLI
mgnify:CR=1 FL=1